ncbi:hypothetical protein HY612_01940 [Candidatus Roizmanbacteria bacterium]|nr:hypothetical protein [Candidatus Roizmanbacteria bacterium]
MIGKMSTPKKIIICVFLTLLIGFNFYLYWGEFKVLVDPNDNVFQYALVDEARNIWKQILAGKLSPLYLLDSWNERWAEGFSLSNYYSHLPQAVIGLFGGFKFFVVLRTMMLIFLPMMFFWAGTILRLPVAYNLILALFSQTIFTDGLYGMDASSFIWRGWGLSAQLMAVFFLPLAFSFTLDYFENKRNLGKAILFNFLVAQSHFGIFSLMLLGYPFYWIVSVIPNLFRDIFNDSLDSRFRGNDKDSGGNNINKILKSIRQAQDPEYIEGLVQDDNSIQLFKRIIIFVPLTLFSLSYFIVPFFLQSQYRNFSVWDPIWKFDSWGWKQVIIWFLNGDLFDFDRFPWITLAVIFGVFLGLGYLYGDPSTAPIKSGSLRINSDTKNRRLFSYLSLVFLMYLLLFFGRTTFGKLIDLVPGLSEFHLHRVIVMVQFTGLLVGAWFFYKALFVILSGAKNLAKRFTLSLDPSVASLFQDDKKEMLKRVQHDKGTNGPVIWVLVIIGLFLFIYLEQPLIKYSKDNTAWIERSNKAYLKDLPAYKKIKAKLKILPKARVYVGRPGNWGRQFTVGEVPLYMVMSQDGFPVIGFLPESWSPNSDPEQFFKENDINFYNLYNVGYSILPENIKPPNFAKFIIKAGRYNLYQIETTGWFELGQSSIALKLKKTNLLNATRLWFGSKMLKDKDYPKIDLSKDQPDGKRWYIEMVDRNNFINLNDGKERNIWNANPFSTNLKRSYQDGMFSASSERILPNGYEVQVKIKQQCDKCIVVLKQSFHPNWVVKLNGERVKTFPVFPFYIGIPLEKSGNYDVSAIYKPGGLKVFLILIEIISLGYIVVMYTKNRQMNLIRKN